MAQYRIVLKKGYENTRYSPHIVQKKVLGVFWKAVVGDISFWDRNDCELYIKGRISEIERMRNNPKDIVIAQYEVK